MNAIIDTTLREGEQTPGVSFCIDQKRFIIDGIVRIGVEEVELGIASPMVECPAQLLKYCRQNHPALLCSLWSRCHEKDIRFAATLSPDIIALSIPVSDILIHEKLGKNREWTASCLQNHIELARRMGMKVAVGFEDATRADLSFIQQMAQLAEKHGAQRVRLADTVGISSPSEFGKLVSTLSSALTNTKISVHCHNDFGMATANAVSALEHGAVHADATLLGLGERCGCTRLEELAGYLTLKLNKPFNIQEISSLAKYIARLTSREIPCNQPFLGTQIFTCDTGLHLQALQRNPATYEPYPAEAIGAKRRFLLGPKAGRGAILSYLNEKGFVVNNSIDDTTLKAARDYLTDNTCNDFELAAIVGCRSHHPSDTVEKISL